MDMLMFWVTLGLLVEVTRKSIQKCCATRPKKELDTLHQPLLKPEEVLDEFGNCRLACCAHKWEKEIQEGLEESSGEEYFLESSEGESYSSDLPDRLSSITEDSEEAISLTEDSEEELTVPVLKIVKWEDLLGNVSVTVSGDRTRSSKGKEIVPELDEEITYSDRPRRSEIIPARIRKDSRGKNPLKIYPEPLQDPPSASLQAPGNHSTKRHSSYYYDHNIIDQSAWDSSFKADIPVLAFTGECSKR